VFDLGNAIVLGLLVAGLVSLVKTLVEGDHKARVTVLACLGVSIVAVFLAAASDFSHEQVLLNTPLDEMNVWSQLIVAVLLAGLASGIWQGFQAVKNIGYNQGETNVTETNGGSAPVVNVVKQENPPTPQGPTL
jgi:hypothetical protein